MNTPDRDALARLINPASDAGIGIADSEIAAERLIANRDAVLRALGLREERDGYTHTGEPVGRRRYVTGWEDVTDE